MDSPQSEHVHLGKLCNRLLSSFRLRQLRHLASQLGLDAHDLGLDNPALKKEAVVTLVARINIARRLDDLLAICASWDASFAASRFDFPIADWIPRPLPSAIMDIVNRALGWPGQPYFTLTLPTIENHGIQESAETGCYDWPLSLNPYQEPLSAEPGVHDLLAKVRHAISEEKAFAYLSVAHKWGELRRISYQPCIVVAPTVDQFDAILIEQTDASNADLGPVEIVNALKSVDVKYGLDILAANLGTVEFRLTNMAKSQKASFSRWLKAFAPAAFHEYKWDTDGQPGNLKIIRLWWD